jgi:hypothetical protein
LADIFQEVDDDVRKDKANLLWSKYGGFVIGICIAVVVATGARTGWQGYEASRQEAESTRYVLALDLLKVGKYKDAAISMGALGDEAGTGYGVLAQLRQAQALAADGDAAGAVAIYDALAKSGNGGPAISGLARLSAVMQVFDSANAADIESRLAPLLAGKSPWRFSASELRATLAYREGKLDLARKQFAALVQLAGVPRGVQQRSQQMLTILGGDKAGKKSAAKKKPGGKAKLVPKTGSK